MMRAMSVRITFTAVLLSLVFGSAAQGYTLDDGATPPPVVVEQVQPEAVEAVASITVPSTEVKAAFTGEPTEEEEYTTVSSCRNRLAAYAKRVPGLAKKMAFGTKQEKRCHPDAINAIERWSKAFGLPTDREIGRAACESWLNPSQSIGSGRAHVGLFQHSKVYWRERVNDFNKHSGYHISGIISSANDQAAVSMFMIARRHGASHWECKSASRIVQIRV